jgi:hypothetical protein
MSTPRCLAAVEILIEKIRSSTTHTIMFTPDLDCVGAVGDVVLIGTGGVFARIHNEGLNTSER